EPLVEAVLRRLPSENAQIRVEGEGRRIAELASAVPVRGPVVPDQIVDRRRRILAAHRSPGRQSEDHLDRPDLLDPRLGPPGDPRRDRRPCDTDPLREVRLAHPSSPQLPSEPAPELLRLDHSPSEAAI